MVVLVSFGIALYACLVQWAIRGALSDWVSCKKAIWVGFSITSLVGAIVFWGDIVWIPGWIWSALTLAVVQALTSEAEK